MSSSLPKNILVADHDEVRCLHTALVIKRLEYNVFAAGNGGDLLRLTNRIIPQLILLDLRMPYSGPGNCLEMLRSDSLFKMIKVVAMGEEGDERFLEESLKKGANASLLHPLHPLTLYGAIQTLTEPHPRQAPRLRLIFRTLVRAGQTRQAKFATMVSEQGVFIRTVNPLHAGTPVVLTLDLPSKEPLEVAGEVVYSRCYEKGVFLEPGMGIKFLRLDFKMKEALKGFIEERLSVDVDRDTLI